MFEITPVLPFKNKTSSDLSKISKDIIRTLLYYNIFNYPLTANEIFKYCSIPNCSLLQVENELNYLANKRLINHNSGLYHLGKDEIINRRRKGNVLAKKFLRRAQLMSSLIAHFPFVECICISGSLSKGYMDEKGDADYFIITTPRRLWVCRSLLMLFKKIFLLNSKKYFCINYFISSDNLEIPDKNIFTATEIATLKPLYNVSLYSSFIKSNKWIEDFYPHNLTNGSGKKSKAKISIFKRVCEGLLSGQMGEQLDNYFFNITLQNWRKKFINFSSEEFDLNMRSRKNTSKHHPRGFQYKVLSEYEAAIKNFEVQHNIQLN